MRGYTDYTQYLQYLMRNQAYHSGGTDTAKALNAVNNEDLRTSQQLGTGSDHSFGRDHRRFSPQTKEWDLESDLENSKSKSAVLFKPNSTLKWNPE